jgi:hypothetical protein
VQTLGHSQTPCASSLPTRTSRFRASKYCLSLEEPADRKRRKEAWRKEALCPAPSLVSLPRHRRMEDTEDHKKIMVRWLTGPYHAHGASGPSLLFSQLVEASPPGTPSGHIIQVRLQVQEFLGSPVAPWPFTSHHSEG